MSSWMTVIVGVVGETGETSGSREIAYCFPLLSLRSLVSLSQARVRSPFGLTLLGLASSLATSAVFGHRDFRESYVSFVQGH